MGRRVSLSVRNKGLRFCAPGVGVGDSWLIELLLYVVIADKTRIRYRKASPTFFQCLPSPSPQLTSIILNLSAQNPIDLDITPTPFFIPYSLCSRTLSSFDRWSDPVGFFRLGVTRSVWTGIDEMLRVCFEISVNFSVFLYDQIKLCIR